MTPWSPKPRSRLTHLSVSALVCLERRMKWGLTPRNPIAAATELYRFNVAPRPLGWTAAPVLQQLQSFRPRDAAWQTGGPPSGSNPWLRFWQTPVQEPSQESSYKLYISPGWREMLDVVEAVVGAVPSCPCFALKYAATADSLLRPDKVIMYFRTLHEVEEATRILHRKLAGCFAQGVPFTASLTEDGLLSWGRDPPRMAGFHYTDSWRSWICRLLGSAVLTAAEIGESEAWRCALQSARRHGVDPTTWIACSSDWGTVEGA
jgi:hypothetical protein